jgi:hypothetical protein
MLGTLISRFKNWIGRSYPPSCPFRATQPIRRRFHLLHFLPGTRLVRLLWVLVLSDALTAILLPILPNLAGLNATIPSDVRVKLGFVVVGTFLAQLK